jgi:polar amino acid transport system substrate-binding protein
MRCLLRVALAVFVTFFALGTQSFAAEMTASLAKMPVYAESLDKGVLVDLVRAIAKESGEAINIKIVPFARSMNNVITGKADFHMPLIKATNIDESKLEYDHSTVTIFHVNFILYTNKNKTVDRSRLQDYKVETDIAHTQFFDFAIKPSAKIETSLRKLNAGRIDAFVFADFASDPIVKAEGLSNIKRELYHRYDVKIILAKGARGGKVDSILVNTIKSLRAKGEYQKIMDLLDTPYDNWQM